MPPLKFFFGFATNYFSFSHRLTTFSLPLKVCHVDSYSKNCSNLEKCHVKLPKWERSRRECLNPSLLQKVMIGLTWHCTTWYFCNQSLSVLGLEISFYFDECLDFDIGRIMMVWITLMWIPLKKRKKPMKKKNANTKKNSFFQFYLLYTIRLERRHIRRGGGGTCTPWTSKIFTNNGSILHWNVLFAPLHKSQKTFLFIGNNLLLHGLEFSSLN